MRVAVACLALVAGVAHAGERFAWAMGENVGLTTDEPLRYAEVDAERVLGTLVALGGVTKERSFLVRGGDADIARKDLAELEARLLERPQKPERLTLYLSSHGADDGLHLKGSVLPTGDLVAFAKRAHAQVVVLIIDACRSGAVTATKGLKRIDSTPTQLEAVALEGRVFISASGDDEYAQESEALGGSYFTHHLVTGLRGAADSSGDGRVTLDEAYRWAWSHTIEATFGSRAGVQRPMFRVDLRGEGALVLTELESGGARLVLGPAPGARWLVIDHGSQSLMAELAGAATPQTLALPPGQYRLRLAAEGVQYEHRVTLALNEQQHVSKDTLTRSPWTRTAVKGRDLPIVTLSLAIAAAAPLVPTLDAQLGGEAKVRLESTGQRFINQLSLGLGGRTASSSALGFRFTELDVRAGLAHRVDSGRFSAAVGFAVGMILVVQTELPRDANRLSLGPTAELQLEGRFRLAGPVDLYALVAGGAAAFRRQEIVVLGRFNGALGAAVGF